MTHTPHTCGHLSRQISRYAIASVEWPAWKEFAGPQYLLQPCLHCHRAAQRTPARAARANPAPNWAHCALRSTPRVRRRLGGVGGATDRSTAMEPPRRPLPSKTFLPEIQPKTSRRVCSAQCFVLSIG